jgi:hypothetical protein
MSWEWIAPVLGGLFAVAATFFAKWRNVKKLMKELGEALAVTASAIEDDEITRDELKQIADEWGDVIAEAMKVVK